MHGSEPGFYLCEVADNFFRVADEVHAPQIVWLGLLVANLLLTSVQFCL